MPASNACEGWASDYFDLALLLLREDELHFRGNWKALRLHRPRPRPRIGAGGAQPEGPCAQPAACAGPRTCVWGLRARKNGRPEEAPEGFGPRPPMTGLGTQDAKVTLKSRWTHSQRLLACNGTRMCVFPPLCRRQVPVLSWEGPLGSRAPTHRKERGCFRAKLEVLPQALAVSCPRGHQPRQSRWPERCCGETCAVCRVAVGADPCSSRFLPFPSSCDSLTRWGRKADLCHQFPGPSRHGNFSGLQSVSLLRSVGRMPGALLADRVNFSRTHLVQRRPVLVDKPRGRSRGREEQERHTSQSARPLKVTRE